MATRESLPDELREWVESRAAERGVDADRVLANAVLVSREAERLAESDAEPDAAELLDRLAALDGLDEEVETVARRLDALDDEVGSLIEDVRERVIQVKRETDGKAEADHDHPELRETAASAVKTAEAADDTVADADERLDAVEETVASLAEETERVGERTDTLARVAVEARESLRRLESAEQERAAAESIRRTANRNGDAKASCESCGGTVRIGLLSRPRCPHCDESISGVESAGLFGTATLQTGHQPALDGETAVDSPFETEEGGDG